MFKGQASMVHRVEKFNTTGDKIGLRKKDEKRHRLIQILGIKTANELGPVLPTFKTQEQILIEELLANDSLGG